MPEYLAPGVYVEEIPSGTKQLSSAPTAVPAFIGRTATAPPDDDGPSVVTSWADYQRRFGGFTDSALLPRAVHGFFQNGGGRCHIVRIPDGRETLDHLIRAGEPDAIPLGDDVTLVAVPDLSTIARRPDGSHDNDGWVEVQRAILTRCEGEHRMAILDTPPGLSPRDVRTWRDDAGFDSGFGTLYFPWLQLADPAPSGGAPITVPPCGHVAGIWHATDRTRGVWKAPANAVVAGVTGVERPINDDEQDLLNPVGVNAIREFTGRGIRVWGARTLAVSDATWLYVNIRRLATMIESTIAGGMQWTVFEPNDEPLWERVCQTVSEFLHALWRNGALAGPAPDEAFFVKCDRTTTTRAEIGQGSFVLELGFAPLKPAEFVVVRISLRAQAPD